MDFEALYSASFKLLDDTVTDWTSMITKLETLKKDAEDGLHGQANKANWTGYNATVSREFIGKTAGEFGDAVTQATSIRNIMRDTRDELKTQQRLLKEAIERGRRNNLTVTANDGGFTVRENCDEIGCGGWTGLDALRDELQGILNNATEIDSTGSTSLRALVDLTNHGFSDATYKDRDEAANAVREAERLAALAKKKPEDMTLVDFAVLKSGLEMYSGDEIFSEHFATTLGPQGTLNFWAGINNPRPGDLGSQRVEQLGDLQKHLSLTLATATQADSTEMWRWKGDMVNLGDQPISKRSTTMGFQVMSNLMRWGDFDDQFLKSYGTKLIETEKKLTDNGSHPPMAWTHMGPDPLLNRTGTDSGDDPMTGFMKALSNSPDAATEFFNADFVTKDEDHEFEEDADGNGKNEKRELSNFDYLFEEREWPVDRTDKGDDSIAGRNNMALALEAATTGHPAGEMPTEDTLPHNPEQAKLMSALVASISEKPTRLTDHGYMSDSVGQITSEYLPDINRALADDPHGNTDKLFPLVGTQAQLEHKDVTALLVAVGQNPDGHAAVEVAQTAYMTSLMDYHLNPDLPADQRYPHSPEETIQAISRRYGEVSGSLAIGMQEAVLGPAAKAAKEYEHAMTQQRISWIGGMEAAFGLPLASIASPMGGVIARQAKDTAVYLVLTHIFNEFGTDVLTEASKDASGLWEKNRDLSAEYSQMAAVNAAKAHGLPHQDQVADWALAGRDDGFNDAATNAERMADHLTTEVPAA